MNQIPEPGDNVFLSNGERVRYVGYVDDKHIIREFENFFDPEEGWLYVLSEPKSYNQVHISYPDDDTIKNARMQYHRDQIKQIEED